MIPFLQTALITNEIPLEDFHDPKNVQEEILSELDVSEGHKPKI